MGTGKAQDLKQNTKLLAQGGGHCWDRGEETCKGTERAQIILVGTERVQKGKMICDNPVPLKLRCSVGEKDVHNSCMSKLKYLENIGKDRNIIVSRNLIIILH